jgi:CrcB protein
MHYLIVFFGGGIGAAARHWVNRTALMMFGPGYPTGTIIVNVVGSLLMGLLIGLFTSLDETRGVTNQLRLLLTTGFLGGFTTFSTFSLDTQTLWERGQVMQATGYVLASVVLSLAAVAFGFFVTR